MIRYSIGRASTTGSQPNQQRRSVALNASAAATPVNQHPESSAQDTLDSSQTLDQSTIHEEDNDADQTPVQDDGQSGRHTAASDQVCPKPKRFSY